MIGVQWIYVFYRGEEVVFVGDLEESIAHFGMNKKHITWLATGVARRRAEENPESRRLYAEKVNPDLED